ncbi:MAG: hypothetical protein DMG53_03595 [Acidobacteria bacterium]|nr:MAG: hypothetical protein DMG53_03595 [Acidobacteriota bacterium]
MAPARKKKARRPGGKFRAGGAAAPGKGRKKDHGEVALKCRDPDKQRTNMLQWQHIYVVMTTWR